MALEEQRRLQLDGIVKQMIVNKESDRNIQAVVDDFSRKYSQTQQPSISKTLDQQSAEKYTPAFPAQTGSKSNPLRAAGNMFGSAVKFGKGVAQTLNPVTIAKNVVSIPQAILDTSKDQLAAQQANEAANRLEAKSGKKVAPSVTAPGAFGSVARGAYEGLVPEAARQAVAGDFEGAERTLVNDPFGQVAPFVLTAKAGAESAGKGQAFNAAISKGASIVTKPVAATAKAVGTSAKGATKFGVSQATGLSPETITQVVKQPEYFSRKAIEANDRTTLAQEVKTAIDSRLEHLSDTGKGYEFIREGTNTVKLPPDTITSVLAGKGIGLKNGKLQFTKESIPMSPTDKAALLDFVKTFGNETELSGNAFMNARTALTNLSKFEQGKTNASTILARELRAAYDAHGKSQIQGLKELDATYGPEAQLMKQIKTDYLKPDGSFKDNALSKLANLTGKGKEMVLDRLEQVSPGIGTKIKVLKAVEDIQAASGLKVGTYARNAIFGGLVSGGNPVGAIMAAAVSNPAVAVPLLRLYGKALKVSTSVINKSIESISKSTKEFNDNPKLGLSVEDVSAKRGQVADTLNRLKTQRAKLIEQGLSENSSQIKNIDKSVAELNR